MIVWLWCESILGGSFVALCAVAYSLLRSTALGLLKSPHWLMGLLYVPVLVLLLVLVLLPVPVLVPKPVLLPNLVLVPIPVPVTVGTGIITDTEIPVKFLAVESTDAEIPVSRWPLIPIPGRSATLQPDLEFDNFKRHPKRDTFKCLFLTQRFIFQQWW